MKHYRPFRYTLAPSIKGRGGISRRPRIFSVGLGVAVFFGATNIPSRCFSQIPSVSQASPEGAKDYILMVQYSTAAPSDTPSDDDIINAVRNRLRREALQFIADRYGDLDKLNADPLTQLQGLAPATASTILGCSLTPPMERQACINKAKSELRAERAAKIKDIQNGSIDSVFIFSVQSKTNYEGNYVAVVNFRQRGTDKTWQWKLLLQPKSGSWVITDKKEQQIE